MGAVETYFGDKPTAAAINDHIDRELSGPRSRIIARSGLQKWNSRRWTILENTGADGAPTERFAVVTTLHFSRGYLGTRHVDESMGPYDTSIPPRLLGMLEGHGPVNDMAARWREDCARAHRQQKAADALLKRLQHAYETGLSPQVVIGTRTGVYHHVRSGGKWHHTYRASDRQGYVRINRDLLNVEETTRLLDLQIKSWPPAAA